MPLNFTAAHSSKISKRPLTSKSPLAQLRRTKTTSSTSSPKRFPTLFTPSSYKPRLEETGLWTGTWSLSDAHAPQTVLDAITYILNHQFTPLPATLTGLGLSRDALAAVLNYRKNIPKVVLVVHLHTLLPSPTETEKEIAKLAEEGVLRRINVPAIGQTSHLEGVIRNDELVQLITKSTELEEACKTRFLAFLQERLNATTVQRDGAGGLDEKMVTQLFAAGFLKLPSVELTPESFAVETHIPSLTRTTAMPSTDFNPQGVDRSLMGTLTSIASISAPRVQPSILRKTVSLDQPPPIADKTNSSTVYQITLPNMGLLTHLYSTSQSHLISVLSKCAYGEATETHLKEKWDGGVAKGRKVEGKYEGRTRKWREWKGVGFAWVLAGLLGSRKVEGFWAGAMGRGVRLVKGRR